jgi:hypothetical protein
MLVWLGVAIAWQAPQRLSAKKIQNALNDVSPLCNGVREYNQPAATLTRG